MSDQRVYNFLFLCTGNSARSIIGEALLNKAGQGRFRAYSAGSFPKGTVNPHAIRLLQGLGLPTEGLRSKSWDEFAAAGAPELDFVVTVCDDAAGEVCPVWPGMPILAHWGIPDPAAATGTDAEITTAFAVAARQLRTRIDLFLSLPLTSIDRMTVQRRLKEVQTTALHSDNDNL
jgi:arsenate reductase (thioredoxin)